MLKKYLLGGNHGPSAGDGLLMIPQPKITNTKTTGKPYCDIKVSIQVPSDQYQNNMSSVRSDRPDGTQNTTILEEPAVPSSGQSSHTTQQPSTDDWQTFDLPPELELLDPGVPSEIEAIIRESYDARKALRLSKQDITNKAGVEIAVNSPSDFEGTEATRSSASSTRESIISFATSLESVTSIGSDPVPHVASQSSKSSLKPLSRPKWYTGKRNRRIKAQCSPDASSASALDPPSSPPKSDDLPQHRGLPSLFRGRISKAAVSVVGSPKREEARYECVSCFDEVSAKDAVHDLPCKSSYCLACFTQLVTTAMKSEDTFPPKCCLSEIPAGVIRKHLPAPEIAKFDNKRLEFAVPSASRYYCVLPECGRWIDVRTARRFNGQIECKFCLTQVCTICRSRHPAGVDECPEDSGLNATLDASEQAGWRRCYQCRAMVELNTGCRHITCRCGAQFCYTCGAVWRTCNCTEADQRRREQELQAARERQEAETLAEQQEVERAIAAVAEAERQLQEEREAEEAREQERLQKEAEDLARLEVGRIDRITERYGELRFILVIIGGEQQQAMERRHHQEEEASDGLRKDFDGLIAEREKTINSERDTIEAEHQTHLKQLQKSHARTLVEAMQQHRRDQDKLLSAMAEAELTDGAELENLMQLQGAERDQLKQEQAGEISSCKQRHQDASSRLRIPLRIQQMRFEEEEKMLRTIDETNRRQEAEGNWSRELQAERHAMLVEDERRLVLSGGDVELPSEGSYGGAPPCCSS